MKDIHDVITQAKFGDDRLRGSGVVAGQISAFPIDFAGRPYNTLTLPCERVIITCPRLPEVDILNMLDIIRKGQQRYGLWLRVLLQLAIISITKTYM